MRERFIAFLYFYPGIRIYNLFTPKRPSKAFYRSPEPTFLAYFHAFAGNRQWAYHDTINPKKGIVALGFELNIQ